MKRIISIILALLMCLALVSCGKEETPAADETVSETPEITETETTDESASSDTSSEAHKIYDRPFITPDYGTYWEGYDYHSNPTFTLCYFVPDGREIAVKQFEKHIAQWCEVMNIEFAGIVEGGWDYEEYITNLENAANEYDAIILYYAIEPERVAEILDEAQCPWMSVVEMRTGTLYDTPLLHPYINYDYTRIGKTAAEYLVQYDDENLTHIDRSRIGVLCISLSAAAKLKECGEQFYLTLGELDADLQSRYVEVDTSSTTLEGLPYTFVQNAKEDYPEIDHWLCYTVVMNDARDICNAAEEFGVSDMFTIITNGYDDELIESWDNGEETPWKAVMLSDNMLWAELLVGAVYDMWAGQIVAEDLWSEWIDGNDPGYGKHLLPVNLFDKDNYQEYFEWTDVYSGADNYDYDVYGVTRDSFESKAEVPKNYIKIPISIDTFTIDGCEVIDLGITQGYRGFFRYRSIRDISVTSPTVIAGKVLSVSYTDSVKDGYYYEPYTIYEVEIIECIRGEFTRGTIVSVAEYGGYLRAEAYNHNLSQKYNDKERYNEGQVIDWGYMGGIPPLEAEDEVLLFLRQSDIDPDALEIIGSWMGTYHIEDGNVWRYIDPDKIFTFGTYEEAKAEMEKYPFDAEVYKKHF